jgi:hypothetical protein
LYQNERENGFWIIKTLAKCKILYKCMLEQKSATVNKKKDACIHSRYIIFEINKNRYLLFKTFQCGNSQAQARGLQGPKFKNFTWPGLRMI